MLLLRRNFRSFPIFSSSSCPFFLRCSSSKTIKAPRDRAATAATTARINQSLTIASRDIVERFPPIVVDYFIKTINTIFRSSKNYALILSSIHFRASNELRILLDWFTVVIDSKGQNIPPLNVVRFGDEREPTKIKLWDSYVNYWRGKEKNQLGLVQSKTEDPKVQSILDNVVDYVPYNVSSKLAQEIRTCTTSKASTKRIPKDFNKVALDLIQKEKEYLPLFYPFLSLMEISPEVDALAQSVLQEIEKIRSPKISTIASLLTRSIKTFSQKMTKRQSRNQVIHQCVHMRLNKIKHTEDYRHSKSRSFAPHTRAASDTVLVNAEDLAELNHAFSSEEEEVDFDHNLKSEYEDSEDLTNIKTLQTAAQFIADSRDNIFSSIPSELLAASSPVNKILIDNLPPRLREEDFQRIFVRFGGVKFSHIYTSRLFEVSEANSLLSDITDLNKGATKWSQIRKIVRSDSYAFVVLSPEGYAKATSLDLKLFGCSIKGYRCKFRETKYLKSLIVEVLHSIPIGQFVDLLSLCFADLYEITYDFTLKDDCTDYVRLHFESHEMAWEVAAKLEVMLAEMASPFFSFDWIKTTWFYESVKRDRERKFLGTVIEKKDENEVSNDHNNDSQEKDIEKEHEEEGEEEGEGEEKEEEEEEVVEEKKIEKKQNRKQKKS